MAHGRIESLVFSDAESYVHVHPSRYRWTIPVLFFCFKRFQ